MENLKAAFDRVPAAGELLPVVDGVWWLRMPLPFDLDHINLYLLEDDDGWIAVDSGINGEATMALWPQVLASLPPGQVLSKLLVTHYHPDHLGLAGWLCREYGLELLISRPEYQLAQICLEVVGASERVHSRHRGYFERMGLNTQQCDQAVAAISRTGAGYGELPTEYRALEEGDRLTIGGREWRVRTAAGHSPAHVTLHCESLGVLISGDQVLPRISSNVSVLPGRVDDNPLRHWLEALERLKTLPQDTLVLPSHDEPFYGIRHRLEQLASGHRKMLDKLRGWSSAPLTLAELTHKLYVRELKYFDLVLATGECQAHLNYLIAAGEMERSQDAEGVYRYQICSV